MKAIDKTEPRTEFEDESRNVFLKNRFKFNFDAMTYKKMIEENGGTLTLEFCEAMKAIETMDPRYAKEPEGSVIKMREEMDKAIEEGKMPSFNLDSYKLEFLNKRK